MLKYARIIMASFVIGLFSLNANAGFFKSVAQPLDDTATLTGDSLYTPATQKVWQEDVSNPLKRLIVSSANFVKAPFMMLQGKTCDWKQTYSDDD